MIYLVMLKLLGHRRTAWCSVFYSLSDSHTAVRQEVNSTHRTLILAEIFEQSRVIEAPYEKFMIASARKNVVCVVERGVIGSQ